ncbi:hypothetical protein Pla52o_14840 [Novipirellula galeiformis]|uniref:Uncharacterized protein n=1 Tax=Novipirellula galeiformis TaxID=2528004 RepID=A0A5C6CQ28_9BACT|nr:hypothetical protein Pla52o_14840 [Novipirellula galeiformis]
MHSTESSVQTAVPFDCLGHRHDLVFRWCASGARNASHWDMRHVTQAGPLPEETLESTFLLPPSIQMFRQPLLYAIDSWATVFFPFTQRLKWHGDPNTS